MTEKIDLRVKFGITHIDYPRSKEELKVRYHQCQKSKHPSHLSSDYSLC